MDHSPFIQKFTSLYSELNNANLHYLSELYSDDIRFIDAVHDIEGLTDLTTYFEHLYANLIECQFTIHHVLENTVKDHHEASVFWTMDYKHPKINKGKQISVEGTSHIKFTDKAFYHRDYLDMGQMVYEHLPLVGAMVKLIKKRMQS